jgi:hypothetical protein
VLMIRRRFWICNWIYLTFIICSYKSNKIANEHLQGDFHVPSSSVLLGCRRLRSGFYEAR